MNPLENLVLLKGDQRLDSSSTAEQRMNTPIGGSGPTHSPRPRTSPRGNKKWVESVCGSGLASVLRVQHSPENAARERSRVRNLRQAFHTLQAALPSVPPDTKLSKLDVLVLATNYIAHLTETLDQGGTHAEHAPPPRPGGYLHPVKKWPMRSLLYCGSIGELLSANQRARSEQEGPCPQPVFTDAGKP